MRVEAITTLFGRIPSSARYGRRETVRALSVAAVELRDRSEAIKRERGGELTARGLAAQISPMIKTFGAALLRARRQRDYWREQIVRREAEIHEKAIGTERSTDAEWRSYLRSLPAGERNKVFFNDPAARGAALREPGLSGLTQSEIADGLGMAIADTAPDEFAALNVDKDTFAIFDLAIDTCERDLMTLPHIVDQGADKPRPFSSILERESFLTDGTVQPYPKDISLEEAMVDRIEEPA